MLNAKIKWIILKKWFNNNRLAKEINHNTLNLPKSPPQSICPFSEEKWSLSMIKYK